MNGRDRRGFALVFVLVAVGVIVVVTVIIVAGVKWATRRDTTVVTPNESTCQCPDVFSMANRLAQARAAIASINGLIATQAASDLAAGKQAMYSEDLYNQGKATNQTAVDNANKGGWTGKAETPPRNCSPDLSDAPTECLKQALRAHENVHQAACLGHSGGGDWKEAKTMVDYWKEDRAAYQAEADYLDRNINRLMNDPKCKKKVAVQTYPGSESKEDQQQRLAGARRRVGSYAGTIG
jgi:hypothetical protein